MSSCYNLLVKVRSAKGKGHVKTLGTRGLRGFRRESSGHKTLSDFTKMSPLILGKPTDREQPSDVLQEVLGRPCKVYILHVQHE